LPSEGGRRIVLVAAVAANGVIGRGPEIPWRLPGEQRLFKELTLGHTLLMGRTTYESIGRPLPGRTTVVLTRDRSWTADGVLVAHSVEEALALADTLPGDVMVAGGGEVYAALLDLADEQVLSEVELEPEGDAFYPAYPHGEWEETAREHHDGYDRVFRTRRELAG
jgi:dihydrofolate reductase